MSRLVLPVLLLLAVIHLHAAEKPVFYFFHSEVCPHCVEAAPFIAELKARYPQVEFRELEVYRDQVNRELLKRKAQELGVTRLGVPFFLIGDKYLSGFKKGEFEQKLVDMIEAALPREAAAPPAPPSAAALFQKEAQATRAAVEACYQKGAGVPACLAESRDRLQTLATVIAGRTAELLGAAAKKGKKDTALPSKKSYLDQQHRWEEQRRMESDMDEAFCRAAGKGDCTGLGDYLMLNHLQERIQKLLADLQTVEGLVPTP